VTAARAQWRQFSSALAIVAVGVGALFAGPAGAWLVSGVGICVALLGQAAIVARRQRA
jgi:DNA-binding transcriptional regulator of glucitol operon